MFKLLEDLSADKRYIFNFVQKQGPVTKQHIQTESNMKLTTLNRIINDLLTKKVLVEASIGESTGGRKPVLYDVNSKLFYLVGLDISRTYSQIVLTNLKLQVIKSYRFNLDESYSPEKAIKEIAEAILQFFEDLKITKEQIVGVGVGTVGPLDRENGIMLNPINFQGGCWKNVKIKEILERYLGLTVILDNGANTAVLGEYFYGDGKGFKNIAYINCGVGIRNAMITSGRIIRTFDEREDVFGHMIIDIDGEPCDCGNYGCLDCYSSINSILRKFKGELKKGKASSIKKSIKDIGFKDLLSAADLGDTVAVDVITDAALVFATALVNYINLLAPNLIILSGPVIYNSELFYRLSVETIIKKIDTQRMNIRFSKAGAFKELAMAIGASAMVLEKSLGQI